MIYYLILLSIVLYNIKLRKEGVFYLMIGFYLFCLSALLNLLTFIDLSEFIIRIGLIFFLTGFAFSVREYLIK